MGILLLLLLLFMLRMRLLLLLLFMPNDDNAGQGVKDGAGRTLWRRFLDLIKDGIILVFSRCMRNEVGLEIWK